MLSFFLLLKYIQAYNKNKERTVGAKKKKRNENNKNESTTRRRMIEVFRNGIIMITGVYVVRAHPTGNKKKKDKKTKWLRTR